MGFVASLLQQRNRTSRDNKSRKTEQPSRVNEKAESGFSLQAEDGAVSRANQQGEPSGTNEQGDQRDQSTKNFLGRLTINEWLTFLVALGSLSVSYLTYQNASDTSDLKNAVVNLTRLASETKRQADAGQKQADIAESGLRPYVLEQISDKGIQIIPGPDAKPRFSVDVSFANYGATPAIVTHVQGEINIKLPSDSNPDPKDYSADALILMANKDGTTTPLRKTWARPVFNNESTSGNLERIAPYVHGRIEYSDVAGHTFRRFFCYQRTLNANRAWYLQAVTNQDNCPHGEK